MRRLVLISTALAALALAAAALAGALRPDARRPAPKLERISYHVMGGFAPVDRWIEIKPTGEVHGYDMKRGKMVNQRRGRLSAAQMASLARAFRGWDKLQDRYMPDRPVPDGQVRELRYGVKAVMAGDGASNIPAAFTAAEQAVRKMAARALGEPTGGRRRPR